jgi:hypothetical protein
MKTFAILCGTVLALLPLSIRAEPQEAGYQSSKELERLKALAGKWTGTMKTEAGETPFNAEYRVTSGGSVVEEKLFAGTPKEMVTMYHDKGGKLALTHYCMLCNQPSMILKESDGKSLNFDFDPSSKIDVAKETHMHALKLNFVDADTLEHQWTLYEEGKSKGAHSFTLKRAK